MELVFWHLLTLGLQGSASTPCLEKELFNAYQYRGAGRFDILLNSDGSKYPLVCLEHHLVSFLFVLFI